MSETVLTVVQELENKFGKALLEKAVDTRKLVKIVVDAASLVAVARFLRDNYGLDHVKAVTGVDLSRLLKKEDKIEIIYHLGSYTRPELATADIALSTKLDKKSPRMPSLIDVWPSVEFHEREVYEMFGVVFEGHPDLRRLLLPEYWSDIPPMLKEYEPPGR
ncbi:NADH dehydrogenase I subunit C [Candidatus Caldarchaeum subterraneum]|uniref:NADH dehydrogenase I subunit C n=1 Tax=Caldiarchaeum subterraneum TaxID=311458 RepID=E6N8N7_CALS0|nr:NADH dehydrogenase I subunit C [Candidatus Caldarchaeum subterraneum]BAJ51361.1 NADH dehydrogenase I subunit C [Candidatus Caldarchaeum subterraneum]